MPAALWIGSLVLLLASDARAQDAGAPAPAAEDLAGGSEADRRFEAFRRAVDEDPFTDREDDPIGLDARDEELRTMRLPEPEEIVQERIPPQSGEILTAIPGVREVEHTVALELRDGILRACEEMQFESRARLPAEVRYRIAVPAGAALVALEVCRDVGCRTGLVETGRAALSAYDDAARARGPGGSALPIAHAITEHDERGDAIVVRAAPVAEGRSRLVVRVTWAVRAPVRGGVLRLVLPARGNDARAAELAVTLRAIDLVAPAIDGVPAEREETKPPGVAIAITASIPATAGVRAMAAVVPCEAGRCARVRAVAGRPQIVAGDVVIAIDASPSTVAGARGRIAPTVRTLLAMLPARSRVRVIAFAARAEEIGSGWAAPTAIDAGQLELAVERELGSATRFEAVWALASGWARPGTRIVIVGDGGMTDGEAGRAALDAAHAARVLVGSVNVADRRTTAGMRAAIDRVGGTSVDAASEAEQTAAGRATDPLVAQLTALVSGVVVRDVGVRLGGERISLGVLRAGEEIVWEGPILATSIGLALDGATTRATPATELGPVLTALADRGHTALAAVDAADVQRADAGSCSAHGPYATLSAVVAREAAPLALAHVRRCEVPVTAELGADRPRDRRSGLPSRVLLASLRRRVIPPARACFRADRRGRGDYQERAEIRIELADREIVDSDVSGQIEPELRACLLEALDGLEVPAFEGRVIVTWPLYTAPTLPPPVLELAPAIADDVDRVAPREQ